MREKAGKEIVEERNATKVTGGTKSKSAMPKPVAGGPDGIHVSATPSRHGRSVKATPHHRAQARKATTTHSSDITHITSSFDRRRNIQDHDPPLSAFAVPATGHRPRQKDVEDTPSRGFARFMPVGLVREPGTLESPIATGTSVPFSVQQTPSKSFKSFDSGVASTPLRSDVPLSKAHELSPTSLNVADRNGTIEDAKEDNSIYKALGWDDDDSYERLV